MIGIFDSGNGGLSIFRELARLLPGADLTYLSDSAAFPYGRLPHAGLTARATAITRLFLARGARLIVVACNTATVVAIEELRRSFPELPFVGVVPPVKVAVGEAASDDPIIMLSTANTAAGRKYTALVDEFAAGRTVKTFTHPRLAEVVEQGLFREPGVKHELGELLHGNLGKIPAGARLVLGCTHYSFLTETFRELFPGAEIYDPAPAVARQAARLALLAELEQGDRGQREFFTTGDPENFAESVAALLACERPRVERVELPSDQPKS